MGATTNLGSSTSEREVVIERIFDAPRSLVFKAWVQSDHLVKWFGPRDFTTTIIHNDVRTGGTYDFHMRGPTTTITGRASIARSRRPSGFPSPGRQVLIR